MSAYRYVSDSGYRRIRMLVYQDLGCLRFGMLAYEDVIVKWDVGVLEECRHIGMSCLKMSAYGDVCVLGCQHR